MSKSLLEIQQGLVETINSIVDYRCIRANQEGRVPKPPYAEVNRLPTGTYGYNGVIAENILDNGSREIQTNYKASFLIQIHGGEEDDVTTLVKNLRNTLFRDESRATLADNTECQLLNISAPSTAFAYLSTKYEEVGSITISLTATDVYVDSDPVSFDSVEISSTID